MNVGDKKVVALTYTLREGNGKGEVIQEVKEDRPFVYLFGMGGLLPAFKEKLNGLAKGDNFEFTLNVDDAYGEYSDKQIINLDKKIFEVEGKFDDNLVKKGKVIPMEDEAGNPLSGTVVEVGEENVKMDFNHPLAGLDLHFQGEILDVREPTPEELEHGHAHGIDGTGGH
jgi:FKBP-type peptidyl-prolyl cis-trans isomerase SlyD